MSKLAGQYILYLLPSFYLFGLFDANRNMLNCMGETSVATYLVILCFPIHGALSYLIVYRLGVGWVGVTISMFLTYLFLLFAITVYCSVMTNLDVRKAWVFPNRDSFKDWWEIIELAVPGAFLYMIEWSACEGLIMFSGMIGVAEQSTLGIILILMPIFMCFTFGMQYATPMFSGKALGANQVESAYTYARASFLMVAFATAAIGTVVVLTRDQVVTLFTEDPQVRALFGAGMIFTIIETIPDSNQFVLQGVVKSIGKQDAATIRCVVSQIVIGIPLSYFLGVYLGYGIPGLMMGLASGNVILCYLYYKLCYTEPW